MINFLKNIIFLVILISLGYVFRGPLKEEILPAWTGLFDRVRQGPACSKPIAYTLGTFNTDFGVSEKYFLEALFEAEAIWENPYGKDLFVYKVGDIARSTVKVNLIYDYRQQATSRLKQVDGVIDDSRSSYDTLKAEFKSRKEEFEKEKSAFASLAASFEKRNDEYQRQVSAWNTQGGAPKNDYNRLQTEQKALQVESRQLQIKQSALNDLLDEINAMVVKLNRTASALNITVDSYNAISKSRGESFEGGIYHTDGVIKEIDIYEFSDKNKLVRVLAHELGHALGLDHLDYSEAIMYELNVGKKLVATPADLEALKILCRDE